MQTNKKTLSVTGMLSKNLNPGRAEASKGLRLKTTKLILSADGLDDSRVKRTRKKKAYQKPT